MKDWENCDEKYEDELEDEMNDEDMRERYPFLFGGEGEGSDVAGGEAASRTGTALYDGSERQGLERDADHAEENERHPPPFRVRNKFDSRWGKGPNYHYLHELSEEHLPHLNFYRFDNFFAARPAHGFFIDGGDDSEDPQPRLPKLFGRYWLQGELAVLFADTAAGKSILATQIAQSIASGVPIEPFGLDVPAQRVAYFDLELSREQFDNRYSNGDVSQPAKFPFHRNLIRNQPNVFRYDNDEIDDENEFIGRSIIQLTEFSKAKVVIIDNITWLNNSSQTGNGALRIMKGLSSLKRTLGLSILVLAHTPKRRLLSPLTVNDMQGSKMIANFADSISAIGRTRFGEDLRYLKSIKQRNSDAEGFDKRVAVFQIEKDVCFLGMKFREFSDERDHIGWLNGSRELERLELIERAVEMQKVGMSQREIARQLGVSPATINRCLKEARE